MPNPANEVIAKDTEILGGTPVFRGTRVPFQALLDYLEGGQTLDAFLDDFPTVTREAAVHAWNTPIADRRRTSMKLLLDECLPRKLKHHLPGHVCTPFLKRVGREEERRVIASGREIWF